MNPLYLVAGGLVAIAIGLKQLSGQNEENPENKLTESKKRAKVTAESGEIPVLTETVREDEKTNVDTLQANIDSDDGDGDRLASS